MASAPRLAAIVVAAIATLYAVMLVHASGQTALAVALLVVGALALWTYTSKRSGALRYLLPGVAAALLFLVFPMLYTVGISFTNQSSSNLLEFERARAQLVEESVVVPGSQRGFGVHRQGAQFVVALRASADEAWATPPLRLQGDKAQAALVVAAAAAPSALPAALPMREIVALLPALRGLRLRAPDGSHYTLTGLREFAQLQSLYEAQADGALKDRVTGKAYRADMSEGFFTSADGDRLQPGFRVNVGLRHYAKVFSDGKFREPFVSVFVWTVVFAALSVVGAAGLGLLLASLLGWDRLRGRKLYRIVLFLPYAVPGFISILVFKGLFNQNFGEINAILDALFGVRPAWFADPLLAKTMILIVNTWLGYPYIMILCAGLIKAIPADLYEASAIAGAKPLTNFFKITMPLIARPLTPLLISAFAFNFNNFVLISLLTDGRPDYLNTKLPAGTTDILVSYTYRIAFTDSGQNFGLAAAINTLVFIMVALMALVQLKFTRRQEARR